MYLLQKAVASWGTELPFLPLGLDISPMSRFSGEVVWDCEDSASFRTDAEVARLRSRWIRVPSVRAGEQVQDGE